MRSLRLFLVGCAILLPVFAADGDRQRARLEQLRSHINELRAQMQSKSGEKDGLTRLLRLAEVEIGRLGNSLRGLEVRLAEQRGRLRRLRDELAAKDLVLDRHRDTLARQVRAAYLMGRQERFKILLNQQDPAKVSRVMVYYGYLNRARAQHMQQIREHLASLADTERVILDQERELARLHDAQTRELADLQNTQARRRELVAGLSRELADRGHRLDRLRVDERNLETLIRGLEQALADIPLIPAQQEAFVSLRGRLPWPTGGRMVRQFGEPRLGNLVWDGVMISAPEGHEVRAVHHGRVAFADWLRGFGLLLILDHGDGYMTLYGHNQSLFKDVGDWVDAGEPVALVGSSGGRERAGMYFGIRYQGRAEDPTRWCRRPVGSRVG